MTVIQIFRDGEIQLVPLSLSSMPTSQVWEVTAQLLGLLSSVGLLRVIEARGDPKAVLWIWLLVQVLSSLPVIVENLSSIHLSFLNPEEVF